MFGSITGEGRTREYAKSPGLKNLWYVAAPSEELTGTPMARMICGLPLVLYRGETGKPGGRVGETISMEHIMTPETGATCHYFMDWTWDFGGPDGYPTHADVDREQRALIDQDDIPMVEAQQRTVDAFGPAARDFPVKQDRNVSSVHRVLKRMYEDAGLSAAAEVTRMAAE